MVTPGAYNCKAANDEYYQYLNINKRPVKSLKPWDKNK